MNFQEIINEQLNTDSTYVLEEGLFKISPAIAFFAFKDGVVEKVKNSIKDKEIGVKQAIEKVKAKSGKDGKKDNDLVYSYTKEQKKVLAKIYRKYGSKIIKQIENFRTNVAAPYQVIKKEVAKNYMTSDKSRFGMTKEEYYKYRESGRRKIEKKGTYFKDAEDLRKKTEEAREALKKAEEVYEQFKTGNKVDLSAMNIEKVLDKAGLGISELKGWSLNELNTTFNEIEKYENALKNLDSDGKYKIRGSTRNNSAQYLDKDEIEYRISALRERGYSNVNERPNENNNNPSGSFKDAMSIYLLRRENISKIKNSSLNSDYRKFYKETLKDGIEAAKKIYENKFSNYMNLKSTITLNKYESKIWKRKLLGVEYSGNINDWELKIKPEDFKGVEYHEKSPKIIQAEKDFDRELKRFERGLLKIMSDEDVALCKRYKLFNNFLTVKQLKDPSSMFKKEAPALQSNEYEDDEEIETGDIGEKIDSIIEKDYDTIRNLEKAQKEIKSIMDKNPLSPEETNKCQNFLKRLNPKSSEKKSIKREFDEYLNSVLNSDYSRTTAIEEMKTLNDWLEDFKKLNNEEDLKAFQYNINRVKDKLNVIIRGGE